jgi:hypothetical protein
MTKQPIKPVRPTDFNDQPPAPADAKDRDLVTVKFIGQGQAVLGARFIMHNEIRAGVSRSDLVKAEADHAGEFEIVDTPAVPVTGETDAVPLDTANFQAGVVPNPQALPWSMEPGGTSVIEASPAVDPMLPPIKGEPVAKSEKSVEPVKFEKSAKK